MSRFKKLPQILFCAMLAGCLAILNDRISGYSQHIMHLHAAMGFGIVFFLGLLYIIFTPKP